MPGYRLASADTQRIDRMYFCCLCDLLLREAVQTDCGHMYCRSCLDIMHTDSYGVFQLTCIQDNTILCPNNQVFPDMFMRREVFALEVFCTFMEDGCEWKGEVKDLEAHTNNSCEFRKLSCVYRECGMLVKKSDLCQHLETECECRPKTCGFCKNQISLNKLKLHQERECPAYPVVCEKCNKDVLPRAKLLEHQDPVMGDCDAVQGPCPFAQIGCSSTQELNPRQTREHLHLHHGLTMGSEMGAPFTRVSRIMGSLHTVTNNDGIVAENENLREQLRHFSDRINSVERTVASGNFPAAACAHVPGDSGGSAPNNEITRRVNNLENRTADAEALSAEIERSVMETNRRMDFHEHELAAGSVAAMEANRAVNNLRSQFVDKTADHEVLLEESNRKIMEANRAVNNLKSQVEGMQENMERMERRVKSMEDALTLRNVQMADLEEYVRQQELSSYDGVLHWKITEFERRRNEAVSGQQVSFYSPCFSTSRYGYKMCARIYLNGDGMGLGTHISLFFVVMRGQYDAILRWPFRQKVTFMLLDQDNVEHVIDAFRPDPNSSSFQRPRRETNVASGCPMFCSLTELNNHAYVRDDAMVVKIIVDTTDL